MPEISFSLSFSLEGSHCIQKNNNNFETLQLVAGVGGWRRGKFHLATLITRMVFTGFLSCYGNVSLPLGPLVSFCMSPLNCVDSRYFRTDSPYQIKLLLLLGDLMRLFVNIRRYPLSWVLQTSIAVETFTSFVPYLANLNIALKSVLFPHNIEPYVK